MKHGYGCPYHYGPLNYGPEAPDDRGEDCDCVYCREPDPDEVMFPQPKRPTSQNTEKTTPPEMVSAIDVSVKQCARRILACLKEARAGSYYVAGWYSYMRRADIERCADFVVMDVTKMQTALQMVGYSGKTGQPRFGPKAQIARWGLGKDTFPDERLQ